MNKRILGAFAVLGVVVIAFSTRAIAVMSLNDTNHKHNLSSNTAGVKAVDNADPRRTQICIFCHTPHNAENAQASEWAPLWNRQSTSATFQMASSSYVTPGSDSWADTQPQGISKKCLSCHDGTVAIGAVLSGGSIEVEGLSGGGDTLQSGDYGFIGTNLRGGHVISFKYSDETGGSNSFLDSNPPSKSNFNLWNDILAEDRSKMFDRQRKMHCHTCHDPHTDWCDDGSNTIGGDPLWRKECDGTGKNSSVCVVCHKQVTFQIYTFPW